MKKDKQVMLYMGMALILIFAFLGNRSDVTKTVEGNWDISEEVKANNLEEYLVETVDFDYSNPEILAVAQEIKSTTATPYDAVKRTARYVYDNVKYSSKISISYCYDETASLVLETGQGDCVSMSRLDIAILRAMGIPARTVGGCLSSHLRCSALFAVYPYVEAQTTTMAEGDFKKRGYLHEWVEFYVPDNDGNWDWRILESTSSQIFSNFCYNNQYLFYSYDTNKYDRCIISSSIFWQQCSIY